MRNLRQQQRLPGWLVISLLAPSWLLCAACNDDAPRAFVLGALEPDSFCAYEPDNPMIQIGLFDVAGGGKPGSHSCERGYSVRLALANDEPDALQISGATVKLMKMNREKLVFAGDSPLPNPFEFASSHTLIASPDGGTSTGVYEVQIVPRAYAPRLAEFVGSQLLVEVGLHGSNADDDTFEFRPFLYNLEICEGCLNLCLKSLLQQDLTPDEVAQGACNDNAGADGRFCWDPDC